MSMCSAQVSKKFGLRFEWYAGKDLEDPNRHLIQFLDVCDTFKHNRGPNDVIYLPLFPYSPRGKAKEWLNNLEEGSICLA